MTPSTLTRQRECVLSVLLLGALLLSAFVLSSGRLFLRLWFGVALGYLMVQTSFGFATMTNDLFEKHSAGRLTAVLWLFFLTALGAVVVRTIGGRAIEWRVLPINVGTVIGGVLFGYGMALTGCCATSLFTTVATAFKRGAITLVSFATGTFLAFPLEHSWHASLVASAPERAGVFLPDVFGLWGALAVTGGLTFAGITLAKRYEGRFSNTHANPSRHLLVGACGIAAVCTLMMALTGSGWLASQPYGLWIGRGLRFIGVSPQTLATYTGLAQENFTASLFTNEVAVQDLGTFFGALLSLLSRGRLLVSWRAQAKLTPRSVVALIAGGLLMGIGARLTHGCNAGALYTPIANFSLSGWLVFAAVLLGGWLYHKTRPHS